MNFDLGILIGLLSIALSIFFGLFFGLRSLKGGIVDQLSAIRERVVILQGTVEKVWDMLSNAVPLLLQAKAGTITRTMKNLGKVTISASPSADKTDYHIIVEQPVLDKDLIAKLGNETDLNKREVEMFRAVVRCTVLSSDRIVMHVPSTDAKLCTEYINLFLIWLDSAYLAARPSITDFEESILKDYQ